MDLLVKDESPSQVSDAIKDLLFLQHQRSKILDQKLASIFDNDVNLDEPQGEAELRHQCRSRC